MDIMAILFLIFGWVFSKKGLVITALVLSAILVIFSILKLALTNPEPKKLLGNKIGFVIDLILLALSIIKLCIM